MNSRASDLTDEQFLTMFLDASIDPAHFNHLGHVRAAWLLLQRYPLETAVTQTCEGICRLAAHLGVAGKYHRTLTEAMVRLMAQGGGGDPRLPWSAFVERNAELLRDARGVLGRHYSAEVLGSALAREHFVAPDRLPLILPT